MLLVTAVVWTVSLIRSVRLRAFVYSLPLPMTLALVATGHRVDAAQLLGVLGLNLFFGTVVLTHHRWRWPILVADLAGVAVYVGLSALLLATPVPFGAALAGSVLLWAAAMALLHGRSARREVPVEPVDARRGGVPAPARLAVVLAGAVCTGLLGHLLRGMVVTFPYSGVLVAVEARHHLPEFTRHFVRNSLALVGFLATYHHLQEGPAWSALAGAWLAFAVVAVALHLPGRFRAGRPVPVRATVHRYGSGRRRGKRRRKTSAGEARADRNDSAGLDAVSGGWWARATQ
ncbi:hypothetical protein ACTMSW_24325 [Micromonospora sp. BQ11]|uniref:hypothetical protein n=1 Tax=Micromonospora sp. BQ11 TaxID=3452212 RepID=UPI003F8BD03F